MHRRGVATRQKLVETAERLFAEQGIESVSLRDVSRAAGQANHSAAQYHFGDRAGLVAAVYEHRMSPVNDRRHALLDACAVDGRNGDVDAVVATIVDPLVMAVAETGGWYGRFLARTQWDTFARRVVSDLPVASSYQRALGLLVGALADLPAPVRANRIDQMGALLVGTVAGWEWRRHLGEPALSADTLRADLTTTITAALLAPAAVLTATAPVTSWSVPMTTTLTAPSGSKKLSGPRVAARTPAGWVDEPYIRFSVTPCTPTIGAEVGGLSLAEPLDDATFADLHRALLEWKVLFVRDAGLTSDLHHALGRRWGRLEAHPFAKHTSFGNSDRRPEVVRLEKGPAATGRENVWHSDVTWREAPSLGSLLHAIEVPAVGGDTLWADMAAAYDCLDDDVKARIDGLTAVHDWWTTFGAGMKPEQRDALRPDFPAVEHPVVRTHPETGRRTLYVNAAFTQHIVGMDADESDALLDVLYRQTTYPEYQCRFRWRAGDLAIWDNRSTQHYASSDYFPQRRVMERITVVGDRPY